MYFVLLSAQKAVKVGLTVGGKYGIYPRTSLFILRCQGDNEGYKFLLLEACVSFRLAT
jgi:hypothetical protein